LPSLGDRPYQRAGGQQDADYLGKGAVVIGEDSGNEQVVALGDTLTQAGTTLYIKAEEGDTGNDGNGGGAASAGDVTPSRSVKSRSNPALSTSDNSLYALPYTFSSVVKRRKSFAIYAT
jgi:hypothetical protein